MRWVRSLTTTTTTAALAFQLPRLGVRLSAVYHLVPPSTRGVVDVGCDHALLCLALATTAKEYPSLMQVIGIDAADDALRVARRNVHNMLRCGDKYPHVARLDLRLGDGLHALRPEDVADTVCLAGLGSKTIMDVVGSLDDLGLRGTRIQHLVLQPFDSRPHFLREVREFVRARHFRIHEERIDVANGRWFVTMAATHQSPHPGEEEEDKTTGLLPRLRAHTKMDPATRSVYQAYLAHHRQWYANICAARQKDDDEAAGEDEATLLLREIDDEMAGIGIMKEEEGTSSPSHKEPSP